MDFNMNEVSYTRPEYREFITAWQKIRDAVAGEEAIKARGEAYLPKFNGHTGSSGQDKYDLFLEYAHWYGATARTVAGLRGLVFRKDPIKNIPEQLAKYENNITSDGQPMIAFTKDVFMEVLQTNRCGIFIDFPIIDTVDPLSIAEQEALNIRPYVQLYRAETILNWRTTNRNNQTITSLVVLKEFTEKAGVGGFIVKMLPQYRVLYLDEEGLYHQRLYSEHNPNPEEDDVGGLQMDSDIIPIVLNVPLNYIPFYPITDKGITWEMCNSTLLPLVDTNISHYRNSANRENALMWTGNPTPVFVGFSGVQGEDNKVRLGSSEAIVLSPGGSASFLEFTGQGIDPIKIAMLEKEEEMAVLGARIIAPEKRSAETAESATIHRAGEQGVLADIANSVSSGLTLVLKFFAEYHKVAEASKVFIQLNTDYMPADVSPQYLEKIWQIYCQKGISFDTFIYQLQRGEILPSGVDAIEEAKRIANGAKLYGLTPAITGATANSFGNVMSDTIIKPVVPEPVASKPSEEPIKKEVAPSK